jgi:hypothetical protein
MEMIDVELNRLNSRATELTLHIIPDLENKASLLYARIMPLLESNPERTKLEHEYKLLSKELNKRSAELLNLRQTMDNLALEQNTRRR